MTIKELHNAINEFTKKISENSLNEEVNIFLNIHSVPAILNITRISFTEPSNIVIHCEDWD